MNIGLYTSKTSNHNDERRSTMNANIIKTETSHSGISNVLTNIWLIVLAVIVGLAVITTSILVGWPIIAHLAARFTG